MAAQWSVYFVSYSVHLVYLAQRQTIKLTGNTLRKYFTTAWKDVRKSCMTASFDNCYALFNSGHSRSIWKSELAKNWQAIRPVTEYRNARHGFCWDNYEFGYDKLGNYKQYNKFFQLRLIAVKTWKRFLATVETTQSSKPTKNVTGSFQKNTAKFEIPVSFWNYCDKEVGGGGEGRGLTLWLSSIISNSDLLFRINRRLPGTGAASRAHGRPGSSNTPWSESLICG